MAWIRSLNWIILTGKQPPWTGGRQSHPISTGHLLGETEVGRASQDQHHCTAGFGHFSLDWLWFQCSYSTINKIRILILDFMLTYMLGTSIASFTISVLASKGQEVTLQTEVNSTVGGLILSIISFSTPTPLISARLFYGFKESLREQVKNVCGHLTPSIKLSFWLMPQNHSFHDIYIYRELKQSLKQKYHTLLRPRDLPWHFKNF